MRSKRELSELLADVGLFSRCTERQRRTIARHAQIAELPAGVDLIREGEPGDALFVILDGEPRSATVVAATDVKVAVIGIRMFRTLLREFSDLAEQLLIGLAGELREARAAKERR